MKKILIIILGVLLMICGIYFIARPLTAATTLGQVLGVVLIVNGIVSTVIWFKTKDFPTTSSWLVVGGVASIIFGIIYLANPYIKVFTQTFLLFFIAAGFIVGGICRIIGAFKVKDVLDKWWVGLLMGILFLLCGICSFAQPLGLALAIGMLLGINMLICGIDLVTLSSYIVERQN